MLDVLDTLTSLLQLSHVEVTLFVGEVLPLDASPDDLLVFVIHAKIGNVGVVVRPLVAFRWHLEFLLERSCLLLLYLVDNYS